MLELPTVVPYFDLSLQHADAQLLRRMKRWGSGDRFLTAIDAIRAQEPDAAFRSSFIVGFPGETRARARRAARVPRGRVARLGRLLPVLARGRHARGHAARRGRPATSRSSGCASAKRCRSRSRARRATRSSGARSRCSSTRSTTMAVARSAARTARRRRSTASCASMPTSRARARSVRAHVTEAIGPDLVAKATRS